MMLGSPVAHLLAGRPAACPPTHTTTTASSFEYHHPRRERRWDLFAMAESDIAGGHTALSMRAPIRCRNNHLHRRRSTRVQQFATRIITRSLPHDPRRFKLCGRRRKCQVERGCSEGAHKIVIKDIAKTKIGRRQYKTGYESYETNCINLRLVFESQHGPRNTG